MAVMIDIETWGTRPGSAIRSIGAVIFGEREGVQESFDLTFYVNVCRSLGTRDPETVAWWSRQSDDAQRGFESPPPIPEREALEALSSFCCGRGSVWANDPDFDCVMLKSAYEAHGLKYPFAFWSHRSVRTARELGSVSRTKFVPAVQHHALDDAIAQAKSVQLVYSKLGIQ
jgi:hypothetical protein